MITELIGDLPARVHGHMASNVAAEQGLDDAEEALDRIGETPGHVGEALGYIDDIGMRAEDSPVRAEDAPIHAEAHARAEDAPARAAGAPERAAEDPEHVDILQVRFPRLTSDDVVRRLLQRIEERRTTGVCFPDMSTLNIAAIQPAFRRLLQRRMLVFNDGAGVAWAARRQGRPLPDNLNGTDLVPRLLAAARAGTSVYLLGAKPGVAARALERLAERHPHLRFVGSHHGYLDAAAEAEVVATLRRLRPQIVMVAMGNPLQVELIDRHLDDPALEGTLWLAVGGQLDYHGGTLRRAPPWVRRARLEWLYISMQQPYKARRYLLGIPRFVARCLWAERRGGHAAPGDEAAR
ncbi:WecB/TagA/CpsF family glycosyltransferase [Sorangium sp. So ce131]|uniref:WecB/TagA/CpsF family glycosyltransferase n=1 Tax=Sorangium sp. So ce131 TaxID=3133282 RepID=UPI003F6359E0